VKPEPLYAIDITPVTYYRMGSLGIDCDSAVFGPDSKVIVGLCAAGEMIGGVCGHLLWNGS